MSRLRVATTWLDGCSGCHMSFLDIDEKLIELSERIELVYSPLVDQKTIPENIDLALVEGAVSSESDKEEVLALRSRSNILISFGDCAVTANVPGMRNQFKVQDVLSRAYIENSSSGQCLPSKFVPKLIEYARPVHEYVAVDFFLPGCPPAADVILSTLSELLEGRFPASIEKTRFGA
jgi:NAD-reducing hydrogenase small subunit